MNDSDRLSISDLLQRSRDLDPREMDRLFGACRNYLNVLARAQVESWLRAKVDASDLIELTLLGLSRFSAFPGRYAGVVAGRRRGFDLKIARALELICLRCLEKTQEERYPSAHALAGDLERFLKNEEIDLRTPGPGPAPAPLEAAPARPGLASNHPGGYFRGGSMQHAVPHGPHEPAPGRPGHIGGLGWIVGGLSTLTGGAGAEPVL